MIFSVESKASIRKRKLKILRDEMIKKENLHIGDLINYNQFLELYSKYGNNLSEEEFGHAFLDFLKTDYYSLKKNRCKILKREEVDERLVSSIKLNLIKKCGLNKGQPVSYIQLVELYNSIPSKLSFVLFAENVLEVSSHSVSSIKYDSTKNATILNKTNETYFERKSIFELQRVIEAQIISSTNKARELKDSIAQDRNLHIGDEISPSEFYEVYEIYGKKDFLPYDFARSILGISDGKARGLINRKIESTKVWNNENISLEYLLKLRKEIISKEKLHINDRIKTYDEFKKLFEKYSGILSETMFAEEILDMSRASYKNLRDGKTETSILSNIGVPENFWEKTKEEIKKNENVYNGKKITYDEFISIFEKYSFIVSDVDFAVKILQMPRVHFDSLKKGKIETSGIFVEKDSNTVNYDDDYIKEELKKLRSIVISENKLHIGESLSGKRFNVLYEKYGFGMSKKNFAAQILDIKSYRLNAILRDESENTIILLNEEVDKEEIKDLKRKVFKSGEHCIGDKINYKEFLRLYKIYGGKLSEVQFAEQILFISNMNLKVIRGQQKEGRETAIFANLKLADAYLATLKSKVIEKNLLYYRQYITAEFFRMIYKQIPTVLSEADFATRVLEVSRQVYYKVCISKENETFSILKKSGTYKNKAKFLERQNEQIKVMLENGSSYSEICEKVYITYSDLKAKVKQLYKNGMDKENVKRNYVYRKLSAGEEIEEEEIKEYNITRKYVKEIVRQINEEKEFEKLERKCEHIVEELVETPNSQKSIRNYVKKCKEKYNDNFSSIPERTLECFQSCLEFLDENNMEYIKFFIGACIEKQDFFKANEFISFCMQTPDISAAQKQILQQMRISVKSALRRKNAIDMILRENSVEEIAYSTGLGEPDIINLRKKLKKSKIRQ